MSTLYSEEEIVASVSRLTRTRLWSFVEAEAVLPVRSEQGQQFRAADRARLELLCDLCEDFGLEDEALALVVSVIDQLHAARADLHALAEAVAAEPAEVRQRLGQAVLARRR